MAADARTLTWANPADGTTVRPLKFCDPGRMAKWIDEQNQSTRWKPERFQYKDRGVAVRYYVPNEGDLNQWKGR